MSNNSVNFDLNIAIKGFQQSLDQANNSLKGFHDDFKKQTSSSQQIFNSFVGNLGANVVSAAGNALVNLASSMGNVGLTAIKSAGEFEMMSVQLGVLLGSAEAGEAQLKRLQEFAAKTPFELPGIVEANKLLLGFGTTAEDVPQVLEFLGNIAAGSGKPLSELARIFGQVQAETKLSLERMNQLNDAGINLGPTLANKLGIPLKDVRKSITDGKVSFDLFKQSMIEIQSTGGVYAGGMIKQSQTLQGSLSSLSDNFSILGGQLGEIFLPIVKNGVSGLISFTDTISGNIENLKIAAQAIAITASGYGAYLIAINASTIATTTATIALKAYQLALAATPWGLVIAGLTAIATGVYALIKNWDEVKLAFNKGILIVLETTAKAKTALADLFGFKVDNSGLNNAIENQKQKINELTKAIEQKNKIEAEPKAENKKSNSPTQLGQEELRVLKSIQLERANIAKQKIQIEQETQQSLLQIQRESEIEALNSQIAASDMSLQEKQAAYQRVLEQKNIQDQTDLERKQALQVQELDNTLQHELAKANLIESSLEKKKAIEDAYNKDTLARLQLSQKQQIESLTLNSKQQKGISEKRLSDEKALENERIANRKDTLSTIATLSQSNNKTLAAIGKAAGVTQIAIDTPVAISKALASAPPPFNFVLAGLVGTAMAAQAARIASVGNFANGGFVPGTSFSGDKLVANVNSGEAILNSNQQREFMRIANGEGGASNELLAKRLESLERAILERPVVLVADDNELARSVSRGVRNGIEIGRSR